MYKDPYFDIRRHPGAVPACVYPIFAHVTETEAQPGSLGLPSRNTRNEAWETAQRPYEDHMRTEMMIDAPCGPS